MTITRPRPRTEPEPKPTLGPPPRARRAAAALRGQARVPLRGAPGAAAQCVDGTELSVKLAARQLRQVNASGEVE